jgi:uroporphyrinogen III methyltransferase/synthase
MVGVVSLVGAGPGDPQLITVGAVARLAEADVVVYDRLANPALLRHAREGAELIYAGKTPERHTMSQDEINALLIAKAREGRRVVRLKGGDPFVFGRGGEEADALAAAGVPFEIIPGVTSAIAAPAYAGIPVTHRGIASSFAVITGHGEAQQTTDSRQQTANVDWPRIANAADTLIFLMGLGALEEIAAQLVEHGRDASTPVAVVEWGTLPRQRTVAGTLATIAADVRAAGLQPPAVTVVGEVAHLRDRLRWFDARPLSGKRVLVTRTREQASELSRLLAEQGAETVELPTIEIVETTDASAVAEAIDQLRTSLFQWTVFTSPNAISIFMRHLRERGHDVRAFGRASIAAIGPGTAAGLAKAGLIADLVPAEYVAEGLLDAFAGLTMRGQRVLLPRAEDARDTLIDGLTKMGAAVDELLLYRAAVPRDPDIEGLRRLRAGEIDIVTFASSSAVRNLVDMLDGDVAPLRRMSIAAIGPVTAQAISDAGLDLAVEAKEYTIPGLVSAIVAAHGARAYT